LKDRGLVPDLLITSPAVRARSTSQILVAQLKLRANHVIEDERLYLASPEIMLVVLKEQAAKHRHVFIVGHNPGITEFADRLAQDRPIDNMPTCAVFTMEFEATSWGDLEWRSGVKAQFDYPASYAG
jgi:phosphohistidine phosphatase